MGRVHDFDGEPFFFLVGIFIGRDDIECRLPF